MLPVTQEREVFWERHGKPNAMLPGAWYLLSAAVHRPAQAGEHSSLSPLARSYNYSTWLPSKIFVVAISQIREFGSGVAQLLLVTGGRHTATETEQSQPIYLQTSEYNTKSLRCCLQLTRPPILSAARSGALVLSPTRWWQTSEEVLTAAFCFWVYDLNFHKWKSATFHKYLIYHKKKWRFLLEIRWRKRPFCENQKIMKFLHV